MHTFLLNLLSNFPNLALTRCCSSLLARGYSSPNIQWFFRPLRPHTNCWCLIHHTRNNDVGLFLLFGAFRLRPVFWFCSRFLFFAFFVPFRASAQLFKFIYLLYIILFFVYRDRTTAFAPLDVFIFYHWFLQITCTAIQKFTIKRQKNSEKPHNYAISQYNKLE